MNLSGYKGFGGTKLCLNKIMSSIAGLDIYSNAIFLDFKSPVGTRHKKCRYNQNNFYSPEFWEWFEEITPIEQISHLPIASRPVSRKSAEDVTFDDLRAISWVFSWTQTRYNLPGWYGMGKALGDLINEDKGNLTKCRDMWKNWTFFKTVLENAQREMARARLKISARYGGLSKQNFHERIALDFEKARQAILAITGQKELMDNHPVIQKSIRLRNPYTDVLNLVQIELLRRWRGVSDENRGPLRHALFLSIKGIAAAMQSTG